VSSIDGGYSGGDDEKLLRRAFGVFSSAHMAVSMNFKHLTRRLVLGVVVLGSYGLALAAGSATSGFDLNGGTWHTVDPPKSLTTIAGDAPPLLAEAKAVYERNRAAAAAGDHRFDTTFRCLPPGMPRLIYMPGSFEFLQRAEQIVILYEWNRLIRTVDMNVPQPGLIGPSYSGQSVGRWEGRTLRIDTIGLADSTVLDYFGLPHSAALHLTEEYIPQKDATLLLRLTIDDPKTFASIWKTQMRIKHDRHGQIKEDVCLERQPAAAQP
jgi:hypothetical protein